MYPYRRLVKEILTQRRAPRLALGETHRTQLICWPWDIDMFGELNNGRTLTLYDLGRFGVFLRSGYLKVARTHGWMGTVAGTSIRYRRRVRAFERIELRSRMVAWDDRFTYCEQGLWRGEICCSHGLLRLAVTDRNGIVAPSLVAEKLGYPAESPPMPDWIASWSAAEAKRPWPPDLA